MNRFVLRLIIPRLDVNQILLKKLLLDHPLYLKAFCVDFFLITVVATRLSVNISIYIQSSPLV